MWIVVPKVTMEVVCNLNRKSVCNNSQAEDMRGKREGEQRRRIPHKTRDEYAMYSRSHSGVY